MRNINPALFVLFVLFLSGLLTGCSSISSRFSTPLPSTQNWEVAITRLRVVQAEEDRSVFGLLPLSDGDEPYVILIGFRSTFGESGSTETYPLKISVEDGLTIGHVKDGMIRDIPPEFGVLRFEDVAHNEIIGVAVVALELDRSPRPILREMVNTAQLNLKQTAATHVESQGMRAMSSPSILNGLHQSIHLAVQGFQAPQSAMKKLEEFVFSGMDTDEVVGVNSLIFLSEAPVLDIKYPQYNSISYYYTGLRTAQDEGSILIFENPSINAKYEAALRVREF